MNAIEIMRGLNRHTFDKLRVVLGNMFITEFDFRGLAYGGEDVDLIYLLSVERKNGRKISQADLAKIILAAHAIERTVRSYY